MPLTTVSSGMLDSTAQYYSFKNRIINGAMVIDQRNAGAAISITGALVFPVDRTYAYVQAASGSTAQRSTVAPADFRNSLLVTIGTGASPTAAQQGRLLQVIEGLNTYDLNWGTANAQTVTISFWVRSSVTGTYAGGLYNSAATLSYIFTYSISSANTWEYKTVTIPGATTGTWATDNTGGIYLNLDLGSGSNFQGTAGSWTAGALWATSGSVKLCATTGATFYITGVQLEKGSTATSFDYRPYTTELALCQRYYVKTFPQATAPAQNAGNTGALEVVGQATNTLITVNWMLPVEMRDTPSTVTTFSTNAASANWSTNTQTPTASVGSTGSKLIAVRAGTSLAAGSAYFINVTASAEL